MLCLLLLDPTATLRSTRRASSQRFLFYHLHSEVGVESHYFLGLNNTSIIEKDFLLRSKRPRHQTDSTAFLDSSSLKLNLIYSRVASTATPTLNAILANRVRHCFTIQLFCKFIMGRCRKGIGGFSAILFAV